MAGRAERADVVIVGGGVIGSAAAYFLAADPNFDGRILVVEPDPSYADCSTTRSAGSIRQQFSTPENIRMSLFGVEFLRRAEETLAVGGEAPAVGFHEQGYLFLTGPEGVPILEANHAVQTAEGAAVTLLDADALAARFPWLNTGGIAMGAFGHANEGWFDPAGLLQALRKKAISLGVDYVRDRVTGIETARGRVSAVCLESGETVNCGHIVNAAGARAAEVVSMAITDLGGAAGHALPVRPRKRNVFVFDCRERLADMPLTIAPNGVYCRPESGQYICGVGPPEDADPDTYDLEVEYRWFDEVIWPTLAERIPAFEAIKLTGAWVGLYEMNVFDRNAIIGPHPDVANFWLANGFSGHGVQQAPAAGRAIAELIVHGRYRTLDLTAFGFERILKNEPIVEQAVV